MLPPFIIEQIRQREEKERERREQNRPQPRLEIPVDHRYPASRPPEPEEDEPNRGVVILDLV